MNTNLLLAISVIMVGVISISINYSEIHDFYVYSVPLNDFVLDDTVIPSDPDRFQRIKQQGDSICFVTPSNNEYCYEVPKGDENFKLTHPSGSNGVNGEMHLEPANNAKGYWIMNNIIPISENIAIITFSDNSDRYPD